MSSDVALPIESIRINRIIESLIKFLDEKKLFSREEFQEYYEDYNSNRDHKKESFEFIKRVFNYELEND